MVNDFSDVPVSFDPNVWFIKFAAMQRKVPVVAICISFTLIDPNATCCDVSYFKIITGTGLPWLVHSNDIGVPLITATLSVLRMGYIPLMMNEGVEGDSK